ncbi:hypothetical protein [Natronorubrum sp. A-ect3]|uniref:hypothetical protein n=1 Tax=Natronorubrum sp. A-ect3 TaxID=3242698 RepID=UPI00359E7DAA
MSRGGDTRQQLQDPVPLPSHFFHSRLTTLQQVTDHLDGAYVCIDCCLDKNRDDTDAHQALFFADKPSAISHKQRTGHNNWYYKTVYKPLNDGFIYPDIVAAAQELDPSIDTVKLIEGTRDPRRDHL